MSGEANRSHPDIDALAGYASGELDDEVTRRHVESCPVCRLELKRMVRFEHLETDGDLLRDAGWAAAQPRLERAFRNQVLPEVVPPTSPRRRERTSIWERWQIRWLVPVAAAAAVLLVVFQTDLVEKSRTPSEDLGPVRGTPVEAPDIVPEKPVGNIAAAPEVFAWTPQAKEDYYTLAILTPNLEKIFEVNRIPEARWEVTDSLKSILEKDAIYLWSVTGHKGVEPVTTSPNAWFKITDEQP